MNLLEAATTIVTTSDIDALFAIYSQSRGYANGASIRELIEARVDEIATLNGYDQKFDSFRELIEFHDNKTSPLWNFVISGVFLVTREGYPIPYSFGEFVRLFKNTYDLRGFVYLDEDEDGILEVKYKLFKEGETILFYTHDGAYPFEEVPEEVKEEVFQPSTTYQVWDACFAKNIYERIDKLIDGCSIVYEPLEEDGEMAFSDYARRDDPTIYTGTKADFEVNYYLMETDEKTLTLNREVFVTSSHKDHFHNKYDTDTRVEYEPYFKMFDPTPYRHLPSGLRYATYHLLANPFLSKMDDSEIPDDLKRYHLPLDNYGSYDDEYVYVATHLSLTKEEIDRIEEEGHVVTHLLEFSGEFHYYEIEVLRDDKVSWEESDDFSDYEESDDLVADVSADFSDSDDKVSWEESDDLVGKE